MPLNNNDFDVIFRKELMSDSSGGYRFSPEVMRELAQLDGKSSADVHELTKQMADTLNEFIRNNPDRSDPQVAAKTVFRNLNDIPTAPELKTLKKLLIENISATWKREDWGFHNEAASSRRFNIFNAALNQLVFPPTPRIAKIVTLFSPAEPSKRASDKENQEEAAPAKKRQKL